MPRAMQKKHGPKSKSENKIMRGRGTLGETSCESEDENIAEGSIETLINTSRTSAKFNVLATADSSTFQTPERENNLTDYGLEFTTSNIQRTSPRRYSSMRNVGISPDEEQTTRNINSNTPPSRQATNKDHIRKRKQTNPERREKRFWREVQELQYRKYCIPLLPFSLLVRDLIYKHTEKVTRITQTALEALQTSSEMYMTQRLQDAYMLTLHRNRVTLSVKDMKLVNFLKPNVF